VKEEKLLIKIFDEYWTATINVQDEFNAIQKSNVMAISPAVRLAAKVIYNIDREMFSVNEPRITVEGAKLILWTEAKNLKTLAIDRVGFERIKKHYERKIKYGF